MVLKSQSMISIRTCLIVSRGRDRAASGSWHGAGSLVQPMRHERAATRPWAGITWSPGGCVRKARPRRCHACPYFGTARRGAPCDVRGCPGAAGGRLPGAGGHVFRTALLLARDDEIGSTIPARIGTDSLGDIHLVDKQCALVKCYTLSRRLAGECVAHDSGVAARHAEICRKRCLVSVHPMAGILPTVAPLRGSCGI